MSDLTLARVDVLARCLLIALARRERAGRAPQRLLEPGLATWKQFQGNLDLPHLVALLAEDAAVRFPLPADPRRVFGANADFSKLPSTSIFTWLMSLPGQAAADRQEILAEYARELELPHRFAGADLHKIQADKRVLELPGTGGQLVARALEKSPDAHLLTNTTVLTSSWADRAMAGLVAMELDAQSVDFVREDPELAWATHPDQRTRFDLVFGLQPEKGGAYDAKTLANRFPAATIVLV
jgi:hypothetical protein